MAPNKLLPKSAAPAKSPTHHEPDSTADQIGSGTQVDLAVSAASLAWSRSALGIGVIGGIPEGQEDIGEFSDEAGTKTQVAASTQKPESKGGSAPRAKLGSGTDEGYDGSYRSKRGGKSRSEEKEEKDTIETTRLLALGQEAVGTRRSEREGAGKIIFLKTAEIGGITHGNYSYKKRAAVVAVVNAFRKGASLPHAPKAKPDWDDSYNRGRALSQLHPHHIFAKNDHLGMQHVFQLSASSSCSAMLQRSPT
jgi:hypothetical protein